jgi:homogentisate 1,2-dioxygenase
MPSYHRVGQVPAKRHRQFRAPDGRLYAEEVFGTEGFSGNYSILYHLGLPAQARRIERHGCVAPQALEHEPHRHRHLRGAQLPAGGDPVDGRVPLLFNDDVTVSVAVPNAPQPFFYRNGTHDELIFVHEGKGVLETMFGELEFGPGDYLYIPRGTVQHLRLEGDTGRLLVIEALGQIDTPRRYRSEHGQLLEHAPYWERDFRKPTFVEPSDEAGEGQFQVRVKIGSELHCFYVDHHPFDVVGWDGYLCPFALNVRDFEPHTGRLHIPPTVHQTFQGPNLVVCTFVPRQLEWDAEAIPIPYYHANVDSDEVMYYVAGSYGARKVDHGSITLHPRGIVHGPSAGAAEASLARPRTTDEVAVMIDTFRPLRLAAACASIDDPNYIRSWG